MESFDRLNTQLKIALYVPTLNIGGTEHCFVKLANGFAEKGEAVQLVVSRREGVLFDELNDNVTVVDLGNLRFSKSFFALKSYLEKEKPTFLITGSNMHNEFVVLANMFSRHKTKVILTQRNFLDDEIKRIPIYGLFYKFLMKRLYPKAYKVVAVSNGVYQFMDSFIPHLPLVRIYNPFDLDDIVLKSSRVDEEVDDLGDYVLYVGRLVEVKNLLLLLRSFKLLKNKKNNLKLIFVGDGRVKGDLLREANRLEMSEDVLFFESKSNCYHIIKHASCLVLPSFSESFGGVLVEALALGTTVVATPTLGAKEVLEDGKYGYVSNSFDDEKEFSELLVKAIEHPFDKEKLKARAEYFNLDSSISEFLKIMG